MSANTTQRTISAVSQADVLGRRFDMSECAFKLESTELICHAAMGRHITQRMTRWQELSQKTT